ncbi:MAG TPA: hypothetical protein VFK36_05490 [Gemmatimonadales bacterium]|jgi:hypothetical protein|nr:hypothetical protein [Gemmatimonadales bacterium]
MGSHLGAIGLPVDQDGLISAVHEMMTKAALVGASPDGDTRVYAYQDPSGSRSTMTTVKGAVTCYTPSFQPGTRVNVRIGHFADSDCTFERPLMVEVVEGGYEVYPMAISIEDLAVSEASYEAGAERDMEVAALAESLTVFADEAAYRATGTPMAVRSLIPSGMFLPPGMESGDWQPTPRILMSGEVLDSKVLRHGLTGNEFGMMLVGSHGGDYTVLVDPNDMGTAASPERTPLPIGSIVSGTFWLSGRLVSDSGRA